MNPAPSLSPPNSPTSPLNPQTLFSLVLDLLAQLPTPITTEEDLLTFLWDAFLQGDFQDYSPKQIKTWLELN